MEGKNQVREIDPEFLQLLGLIVIRWSLVENWVNDLFVAMTEGNKGAMIVVTSNVSQNAIIGWIRTLLRISQTPFELAQEITETLDTIDEIRLERNGLIHGLWTTEGGAGAITLHTVRLDRREIIKELVVTASDLRDLVDDILEVATRLKAILIRCKAYP